MIDHAAIAARLTAQVPDLKGGVEVSLDIAEIADRPVKLPQAFLCPTGDRAGPPAHVTGHDQRLAHSLLVLLGLPSRNDPTGGGGVSALEALRRDIRAALHGWMPAGGASALIYTGGRLIAAPKGAVWWGLTFSVDTYEDDPT
ncbi:hypothetical protein [Caenispirillum bisanense]|uniref:Gp37 protein n=1 Tax=Caenispirillum bisanense TaxID=414052 RepID=A0A286GYR4_9PROT|nr:hypothetical protein [Caenispirillum bisanense]SOE00675.1 hypothetical protein SAMN05421508_11394 [Caenispirillum bisanense]